MVKLLPDQFAELKDLGVFNVEEFDNRFHFGTFWKRSKDARWNCQFAKLEAYASANGHTQPPTKSELGKWVREQRRGFFEKRLTARLEALKEWCWNNQREHTLLQNSRLTETRNSRTLTKWRPHLLEYFNRHRTLNVPRDVES
jgi:hypothetical protein